ncbi:hypothetical protein C809_01348 [Lachnospiraceae bacterium MD335]|nr:hypothetical protein C809_01348 [Lachnospiraceae bacterium MD335]
MGGYVIIHIVTPQYFDYSKPHFFAIPHKEIPSLKATAYCTAVAFFRINFSQGVNRLTRKDKLTNGNITF